MAGKKEEKMEWSKPVLVKLGQEIVAHGAPCTPGSAATGKCTPGFGV